MIKKFAAITTISLSAVLLVILAVAVNLVNTKQEVSAAQAKDFNPGRIIDNSVFYNNESMTVSQIQNFLNSKVPTCDTNGTGMASDWGRPDITRATLASYIRNGTNGYTKNTNFHAPPYTCLKDYKKDTPQMEAASGLCGGVSAKTNQTAAQMIKAVADACGINPQVLVILLEKEQSLVTDIWPLQTQFNSATGFDCPDTAPCDPAYAGLFYQIYYAARQFKVYQKYPNDYNYIAGRTNRIYWHPDLTRCGSSQVFIENQATAALYIYTPYRPNQAALNNLYGTGDSCSSYGNRNFWRIFTDWFGSTRDEAIKVTRSLFFSPSHANPIVGEPTAASFILKNTSNKTVVVDSIKVTAKPLSGGQAIDFPAVTVTLAPGQTYEYYQSRTFDVPGSYQISISGLSPGGEWSDFWPYNSYSGVVRQRNITVQDSPSLVISRSMFFSPANPPNVPTHKDTTYTSFIIKNSGNKDVVIPETRVVARHTDTGDVLYYPSVKNISLAPGEEYTYYKDRVLSKPGSYKIDIQTKTPYGSWTSSWPESADQTVVISRTVDIARAKNVSITRDIWVSPLITGQSVGASFKIKNNESSTVTFNELMIRASDAQGTIVDYPSVKNISLAPGEEYTYYQYQTINNVSNYTFQVYAKIQTDQWVNTWPEPISGVESKVNVESRLPNLTIERNLWRSPVDAKPGQSQSASFVIKNNENRSIIIDSIAVGGRSQDNSVVDFPHVKDLVLGAGQSYEYYQSRVFDNAGQYRIFIVSLLPSGDWSYDWPRSTSKNIIRDYSYTVK